MTLLEELRNVIGDRTDDDALALIERVSELESQSIELEGQMKQLDEAWRKRYRDRFYEGEKEIEDEAEEAGSEDDSESVSIDDLFEE